MARLRLCATLAFRATSWSSSPRSPRYSANRCWPPAGSTAKTCWRAPRPAFGARERRPTSRGHAVACLELTRQVALVDEPGRRGGLGKASSRHDERPCAREPPADEIAVGRGAED